MWPTRSRTVQTPKARRRPRVVGHREHAVDETRRRLAEREPHVGHAAGSEHEAAVAERAERVLAVEAGEHRARLLAPRERVGRRDAMVHLHHAAFEDAVLGPRAGIVLDARDFHVRDRASGAEMPHAVAVGVPGEVSDDRRLPRDQIDQALGVVGVDAEVGEAPLRRVGAPRMMVAHHNDRAIARRGEVVGPRELLVR